MASLTSAALRREVEMVTSEALRREMVMVTTAVLKKEVVMVTVITVQLPQATRPSPLFRLLPLTCMPFSARPQLRSTHLFEQVVRFGCVCNKSGTEGGRG